MVDRGKNRMQNLLLCVVTIYMVNKATWHWKELLSEALQDCRLGEKAQPVQKNYY